MPSKVISKTWECTIFGEDLEAEATWLKSLEVNKIVVARETCPDTEREHLQGQITFKRAYTLAALKKLHNGAHWEATIAAADANYCRKRTGEPIIDIDNRQKKGARTDIEVVKAVVQDTQSMKKVVEVASSVQGVRMAELWLKYHEKKRPITPAPEIHWRWGKAGVGKTREIWDKYDIDEVYTPTTFKWWEGYDAHRIILIDELRANWCTFGQLLRLLDRYPFTVETKGGSRQFHGNVIYITSCKPPHDLYDPSHFDADERVEQLLRRLTTVERIG